MGTTRLLVTNQLQYAHQADRIVYLGDSRILESGTYAELMNSGGVFASMMADAQIEEEEVTEEAGTLVLKIGSIVSDSIKWSYSTVVPGGACRLVPSCSAPKFYRCHA